MQSFANPNHTTFNRTKPSVHPSIYAPTFLLSLINPTSLSQSKIQTEFSRSGFGSTKSHGPTTIFLESTRSILGQEGDSVQPELKYRNSTLAEIPYPTVHYRWRSDTEVK